MKLKRIIFIISSLSLIIGITIKYNLKDKTIRIEKQNINSISNYIEHRKSEYLAILEIPKINLKRGLKENTNVNEDIVILDINKFKKNIIVLASHSGNCDICYFNRLDELLINDKIYLYKDNVKYIYQINKIKELKKNTFKIEEKQNSITLITCSKLKEDIQIIIEAKQIKVETY